MFLFDWSDMGLTEYVQYKKYLLNTHVGYNETAQILLVYAHVLVYYMSIDLHACVEICFVSKF